MISLKEVDLSEQRIELRRPFGFGIAQLTALDHLLLRATFEIDGETVQGIAGENLAPRWFIKDPNLSLHDDVAMLRTAVVDVTQAAIGRSASSPFQFWWEFYSDIATSDPTRPNLVTQLAVSLIERVAIDAWCRRRRRSFATLLRDDALGIRADAVHPILAGMSCVDALPSAPAARLYVRHTVGLADEIDQLPRDLSSSGIRRLKIKLSGNANDDIERLASIEAVCARQPLAIDVITLDGNENYTTAAQLDEFLGACHAARSLQSLVQKLVWLEQPLHRDVALAGDVAPLLQKWAGVKFVLDESDASPADLPRALSLGYAGATHKNCKGVFKSILARMLLRRHEQATGRSTVFSGEDLTIVAPWSQTQDLAVASALGVVDIERNGHHYADGLSAFSPAINRAAAAEHPELYALDERGVAHLLIRDGQIDARSCTAAPFGSRATA